MGRLDFPPSSLPALVHGTAICLDGDGLLIVGAAGSGKSTLALEMMALGARLVVDDLCRLERGTENRLRACRPPEVPGPVRIEARGLGLLEVPDAQACTHLLAVVDLDRGSPARLPDPDEVNVAGIHLRRLARVEHAGFPAMLIQYLRQGRQHG